MRRLDIASSIRYRKRLCADSVYGAAITLQKIFDVLGKRIQSYLHIRSSYIFPFRVHPSFSRFRSLQRFQPILLVFCRVKRQLLCIVTSVLTYFGDCNVRGFTDFKSVAD